MISYANRTRRAVNYLKTIYFDRPEWTPCEVGLLPATWIKYREELEEVVLAHPKVFPGYKRGRRDFDNVGRADYEPGRHTDCWGCVWQVLERGMAGQVVEGPLEDWDAFEHYRPPDPMTDDQFGPRDWGAIRRELDEALRRGGVAKRGGLPHGFMYMRLYYLRGFENFMVDLAAAEPRLHRLIEMVEGYNAAVIRKVLGLGAEMMGFGDDLGLQTSLPMSPRMWRQYLKPSFMRIFEPCRRRDVPIDFHTDGHVLPIIPDLIEAGVRCLNPQIRANGLEGLQEMARGRVALRQDLDRQLFPFATTSQIEDHIGEVYEGLHLDEGGLILSAECAPDVPLANIDAICTALERVCRLPEAVEA